MKTTLAIFIFFIIAVAVFPFLHLDKDHKLKSAVVTSNFALYDISKALLKEDIKVEMLLPVGVDLHTFEPTPKDIIRIKQSDFFVYSGANIEHYLEGFSGKNALDMSKYITLISHNDEPHHQHNGSDIDPHYWLDIANMITLTNQLEKFYSNRYVNLTPKISKRADIYRAALHTLDREFQQSLQNCSRDTIVVNHNAYAYLAHKYHFKVQALSGLSSDAQVNAKVMIEISKTIQKSDIETIFYDAFESANEIKALSDELHVKVDRLNTLANITQSQYDSNASYVQLMQENLVKISTALECQ